MVQYVLYLFGIHVYIVSVSLFVGCFWPKRTRIIKLAIDCITHCLRLSQKTKTSSNMIPAIIAKPVDAEPVYSPMKYAEAMHANKRIIHPNENSIAPIIKAERTLVRLSAAPRVISSFCFSMYSFNRRKSSLNSSNVP